MNDQQKTVTLGERMKEHEKVTRVTLEPRVPVILRVDGKAFHTYLKNIEAHDSRVNSIMDRVAQTLCKNIQGAQFAYVQSDEVSVLIHSYKRQNSSAWYDNQVQKMCSVAASIASVTFSLSSWELFIPEDTPEQVAESYNGDVNQFCRPAYFDARVFNVPEADVCNYFIWRQQDAIRNSVAGQARKFFSHKQLEHQDQRGMKEMLFYKGQPWENLPIEMQRGRGVAKHLYEKGHEGAIRSSWEVDRHMPLFIENRGYVENHLAVEPEDT